jgi:hypothetical protein
MKQWKIILILISLLPLLYSYCFAEELDIIWSKLCEGRQLNRRASFAVNSMQRTTDNGYIIVGHSGNKGDYDVLLMKIDENGDSLWTRTYGEEGNNYGIEVQQTLENGYIISAHGGRMGGKEHFCGLLKTDANGDTEWTKMYAGYINSFQLTLDGGFIICGDIDLCCGADRNVFLAKTDKKGNVVWEKKYGGSKSARGGMVKQTLDGGYIIVGDICSLDENKKDVYLVKTDSLGNATWTKEYGGEKDDVGFCVQQTVDGGYILAGYTESFGAGRGDVYLIKTDGNGNELWKRIYGGKIREEVYSVQQTSDGGYIFAGKTSSFGNRGFNLYLIKTDKNGDSLWTATYGYKPNEDGKSVWQTKDGGYITVGNVGPGRICLVKTDGNGNIIWTKIYGGTEHKHYHEIGVASDGGYVFTGSTTLGQSSDMDVFLLKANPFGDTCWSRKYGGRNDDVGYSVQQDNDGNYIIVGWTRSFGVGKSDVYIVKTDGNGDTIWTRNYGGEDLKEGFSLCCRDTEGYLIAGQTRSFGAGKYDIYLLKVNTDGDTMWTRTYGGEDDERGLSIQGTSNGGFIVAGWTKSFGAGDWDVYLVKIDSKGDTVWTKMFGGEHMEVAYDVKETNDSGYIVVGEKRKRSKADIYLIKTDRNGDTLWTKIYDASRWDSPRSIQQTTDRGYIIVGITAGKTFPLVYVIRTDKEGNILWEKTCGEEATSDEGISVQKTYDGGYIILGEIGGNRYLIKMKAD